MAKQITGVQYLPLPSNLPLFKRNALHSMPKPQQVPVCIMAAWQEFAATQPAGTVLPPSMLHVHLALFGHTVPQVTVRYLVGQLATPSQRATFVRAATAMLPLVQAQHISGAQYCTHAFAAQQNIPYQLACYIAETLINVAHNGGGNFNLWQQTGHLYGIAAGQAYKAWRAAQHTVVQHA